MLLRRREPPILSASSRCVASMRRRRRRNSSSWMATSPFRSLRSAITPVCESSVPTSTLAQVLTTLDRHGQISRCVLRLRWPPMPRYPRRFLGRRAFRELLVYGCSCLWLSPASSTTPTFGVPSRRLCTNDSTLFTCVGCGALQQDPDTAKSQPMPLARITKSELSLVCRRYNALSRSGACCCWLQFCGMALPASLPFSLRLVLVVIAHLSPGFG